MVDKTRIVVKAVVVTAAVATAYRVYDRLYGRFNRAGAQRHLEVLLSTQPRYCQ